MLQQQQRFSSNIPGMTRKRKEKEFERVVESDKPVKHVMALKEILLKEPELVISLGELGMLRRQVGLQGKRRFVTLIRKYPAIFDLYVDKEDKQAWCGFAPQAEKLAEQEVKMREAYEPVAVEKLRKLLMMSVDRKIHVPKIAHLRRDLGFPEDFQKRMVHAYPEYFRVVDHKDGPLLELTSWDPSLAVTSLEKRVKETGELNSEGEPLFKMCVSKALTLSKKQKAGLQKFQERPFISPYTDSRDFSNKSLEFEKRQVALLHEILSMTLEKKTVIDYLTHFRKEYRLPKSVLALVVRHHAIFYVSRKGGRFSVFLKEAYEGSNLIDKNEWVLHKEKFMALMALGRKVQKVDAVESTGDLDVTDDINGNKEECDLLKEVDNGIDGDTLNDDEEIESEEQAPSDYGNDEETDEELDNEIEEGKCVEHT